MEKWKKRAPPRPCVAEQLHVEKSQLLTFSVLNSERVNEIRPPSRDCGAKHDWKEVLRRVILKYSVDMSRLEMRVDRLEPEMRDEMLDELMLRIQVEGGAEDDAEKRMRDEKEEKANCVIVDELMRTLPSVQTITDSVNGSGVLEVMVTDERVRE